MRKVQLGVVPVQPGNGFVQVDGGAAEQSSRDAQDAGLTARQRGEVVRAALVDIDPPPARILTGLDPGHPAAGEPATAAADQQLDAGLERIDPADPRPQAVRNHIRVGVHRHARFLTAG